MFYRKSALLAVLLLAFPAAVATAAVGSTDKRNSKQQDTRVLEPLNLAILIQDDLTSQVSNELTATRAFIRTLPGGLAGDGRLHYYRHSAGSATLYRRSGQGGSLFANALIQYLRLTL